MDLVLVQNVVLYRQHDKNGDQIGNEVIETQPTGVVVEEEQHHNGRQVHDELHVGHTGLLLHLHALPCGHHHVEENGNGGQYREQAHVIPIKWDGER